MSFKKIISPLLDLFYSLQNPYFTYSIRLNVSNPNHLVPTMVPLHIAVNKSITEIKACISLAEWHKHSLVKSSMSNASKEVL